MILDTNTIEDNFENSTGQVAGNKEQESEAFINEESKL